MGPAHDLAELSDHDLLAGGVADGVAEARANAARWGRLVEFHSRREADYQARTALSPRFTLTPRAETVTEVSALWGLSEPRVRHELNVALFLHQYFAEVWALCAAGQLDGYRATVLADAVRHAVTDPLQLRILAPPADRVPAQAPQRRPRPGRGAGGGGVHPQAAAQQADLRDQPAPLRRRRGTPPPGEGRPHRPGHRHRRRDGPPGHHRNGGPGPAGRPPPHPRRPPAPPGRGRADPRPAEVRPRPRPPQRPQPGGAGPGVRPTGGQPDRAHPDRDGPERRPRCPGRRHRGPGRAGPGHRRRPRRHLAPDAHRPRRAHGRAVHHLLQADRADLAARGREWTTCYEPACDRSAAQVEIDHRTPYPRGATTPGNLWPACKRGHTAKHAPGFTIEQHTTGSYRLRTAAGFTHQIAPPAKPVNPEWPDLPDPSDDDPIQFTATELLSTLRELRNHHDQERAEAHELEWEHGYRLDQLKL